VLRVIEVVEVPAEATYQLRRAVLRDGTPSDVVAFDGDDLPNTFHLAARDEGGSIVGIASFMERPHPDLPAATYQLRGMATSPWCRGRGVAGAILDEGLRRLTARDVQQVWARARVSALGFYLGHGFETHGDEYVDTTTALPHVDITRRT